MPAMSKKQLDLLLDLVKDSFPVSISFSDSEKEKAQNNCNKYLRNKGMDISEFNPYSVYLIISKLSESEQIEFIEKNIDYIKENDEEIFLYKMMVPASLSSFLSYKVIKHISKIDKEIFQKIINSSNLEALTNGFNNEDYYEFLNEFYDEVSMMRNIRFIDLIHYYNRHLYAGLDNYNELNKIFEKQELYNIEFMNYVLKKFKKKISNFKPNEALSFIKLIKDIDVYEKFVNDNYDKLNKGLEEKIDAEINEYLSGCSYEKQKILTSVFFDSVIKIRDIRKVIYDVNIDIIIKLYRENKEIFNPMTLSDWIMFCASKKVFNSDLKEILDTYEINDIECLFDASFFTSYYSNKDINALSYIELKYRNNIQTNNVLEPICNDTSIFSSEYLKNLKELRNMLKNKIITKNDDIYISHLSKFIKYLKDKWIIDDINGIKLEEVEKLFYRIVMGSSIAVLYNITSINDIAVFNRLGKKEIESKEFSVEQIRNFNVKHYRNLCAIYDKSLQISGWDKTLILKLYLMVGYNKAKKILETVNKRPVLEHLTDKVDVKKINIGMDGTPILNQRLINMLFDSDIKIEQMLLEENTLYGYFPRIFNEWEFIQISNKDKSLNTVLDYLKSNTIVLSPKYYRLKNLFNYIGCSNSFVEETTRLHDKMLSRTSSSIPRVFGTSGEYTYEILKYNDTNGLVIGNKTNCCFTILGRAHTCLEHALTSDNGRILEIRKNGKLIAHSWLWRNGDLLCLDNIEVAVGIKQVDFLNVYQKFADAILAKSFAEEGVDTCIKNVTIGFTDFDKPIKGIEQYKCLISNDCDLNKKNFGKRIGNKRRFVDELPGTIEFTEWNDSKNVQYIIKGTGDFNLGIPTYRYIDERNEVIHYDSNREDADKIYDEIIDMIICLMYIRHEQEGILDEKPKINKQDLKEIYCNEDWFIICYKDGSIDKYINSNDERAEEEYTNVLSIICNPKVYVKKII